MTLVRFALLCLLCLPSLCHAAPAALNDFGGPAPLRNQRPYNLLFLAFVPQDGQTLARGAHRELLQVDIANTLLIPDPKLGGTNVLEDTETQRVSLSGRLGIGGGTELDASVPLVARDGGILDQFVRAYHEGVGLIKSSPDVFPGRPHVPSYRSIVRSEEAGVDVGSAFGVGDVSLFAGHQLMRSERKSVSMRLGVKLPTSSASQLIGSGGTDYGADVDGTWLQGTRTALYGSLGYERLGRATYVRTARRAAFSYLVGVEYIKRPGLSYVLQTDGGSTLVRTGNSHADAQPATLALSVRRGTGSRVWTYSFTENGDIFGYKLPFVTDIGPDVTFSAGLEWR